MDTLARETTRTSRGEKQPRGEEERETSPVRKTAMETTGTFTERGMEEGGRQRERKGRETNQQPLSNQSGRSIPDDHKSVAVTKLRSSSGCCHGPRPLTEGSGPSPRLPQSQHGFPPCSIPSEGLLIPPQPGLPCWTETWRRSADRPLVFADRRGGGFRIMDVRPCLLGRPGQIHVNAEEETVNPPPAVTTIKLHPLIGCDTDHPDDEGSSGLIH